jgi:aminoglycoside phosphotransferase (APT) family kinase protein
LDIRYSEDAQGTLPPSLILKRSRADLHPELLGRAAHEAAFYNAVSSLSIKLPIATCYSAHHDETSHRCHVLLADLSKSHFQQPLPIPPSNRHCALIVESLAQLHAAWWNSPRLGIEIGVRLDQEKAAASVRRLTETFPRFVDFLGDALLPQQRAAYERILASDFLQRLTNRLVALQDVTLIHGDAHTGNLMLPHDLEQGRVLLIDWQLWDLNVAAIDLAFLMALHWSPPRRSLLEQPLLRHYYDHLLAGGVAGYTWDDLWRDYRESVIIMALIPIGQWRRRSPTGVIWFGLQDSMAAFEDLNCGELLS